MKKFSNITNQKVGEEPKVESKINEEDIFKGKVNSLLDNFLTIRTYGPIQRYFNASTIKISGKELFLEALMDLLKDKDLNQETKILESLKSSVKDWEAIDSKIEEANNKIEEIKSKDKMVPHRNKLNSLFNSYGSDEEMLINMVEESCKKINDMDKAYLRSLTAEYMANEGKYPKEVFQKISEKFRNRAQQLGYNG
jgi:replication initiation and membrane attachment protein DnaB